MGSSRAAGARTAGAPLNPHPRPLQAPQPGFDCPFPPPGARRGGSTPSARGLAPSPGGGAPPGSAAAAACGGLPQALTCWALGRCYRLACGLGRGSWIRGQSKTKTNEFALRNTGASPSPQAGRCWAEMSGGREPRLLTPRFAGGRPRAPVTEPACWAQRGCSVLHLSTCGRADAHLIYFPSVTGRAFFPSTKSCRLSWANPICKKLKHEDSLALFIRQTIPKKSHKCCFQVICICWFSFLFCCMTERLENTCRRGGL